MSVVKDFALTTPLLGNQSFTSPVVDFLGFNTLQTASFYNTTDATQTTQQILFQFSAERTQNFNFNQIVTMRLNEGVSLSFPIRARFGRYVITNTSSTPMTELRLSSLAFEEIQEVGINQVVDLEATLQAEDQRITDEIAARIAGDLNLQNQVFLKANQTDLNLEAVARATEDIRLDQAISQRATTQSVLDEQGARESADVLLQLNINAEATARALGDTNLQISIDSETTARALADTNIQTDLNTKATITALAVETSARETADSTLLTNINLKASTAELNAEIEARSLADNVLQGNIDTENQGRVSADTALENSINLLDNNLNLKLAEANSVFKADYTKYVVDNRDNIQEVINSITNQGSVVYLSSGSIGGSGLIIDKQNVALIAPKSSPPSLEILQETTTAISADRIKFSNIQIDGVFNAGSSRSVYTECDFMENVNILASQISGYMTFDRCGFVSGKTINVANNFANVIYFINCNFGGCSFSLNQSSNQQVIFNNCGGFLTFPSNAFYAGINALTTGYIQNTIAKTILPSGSGTAGQVLTSSGSASIPDTWTTPSGGGSGGGGNDTGKCLEMIHLYLYPIGQSVTSVRGDTLSFQNVTERQLLTQSAADLTGSVISYRPPTGTTKVIYTFYTHLSNRALVNSNNDANFRVFFGSTQVTVARQYVSLAQASATGYHELSVVFNIGGTENIANAILGSWNSLVQLKWDGARQSQTEDFHIHNLLGFDEETVFSPPKIKIEAYA